MTNTTTEILSVNGVVLNTYAKNISSLAGRLRTPAKRTENIVVPGGHGALRTANKRFDQNNIILPMWVIGCDDDGMIPGGSNDRIEFYKRVDELTKLFKGSDDVLDVRHTLPDGSVRQTFGDALDVFDFTTDASPKGLFSVNIQQYYPAWQDVATRRQNIIIGTGVNTPNFTDFAASTFPMEDILWELTGPWTNPRLTFADGSWVQYNGAIAASQKLSINSDTWELTATGFTPVYSSLIHDGADSKWATLPAKSQVVTVSGTARTTATALAATGRRKYLVG